jgi:aldose 1-epimerase
MTHRTSLASLPAAAPLGGRHDRSEQTMKQTITEAPFGRVNGVDAQLYTLTSPTGLVAKITNYGGLLTQLWAPDKEGKSADIVLGYDTVEEYVKATPYFGAVIGRVANRIKDARFELGGKTYQLAANDHGNSLHGGVVGWDKVIWRAVPMDTERGPALELTYESPAGEEGFPGMVVARNRYTLTKDGELVVEMSATTDATTIVNMAHHTYWNLAGHGSGTITGHELVLFADHYTPGPSEDDVVPDGRVLPVARTPFDFTQSKLVGKDLVAAGGRPIGFDHNWVVRGDGHRLRPVAKLRDPRSGRVLELSADQPGVQFYSGNFLDGSNRGKGGVAYEQYTGLCLETQKFPNSINVPEWKDEVILDASATYRHTMVHKLSVE